MKEPKEMALLAAKALSDKKGREIQVLEIGEPDHAGGLLRHRHRLLQYPDQRPGGQRGKGPAGRRRRRSPCTGRAIAAAPGCCWTTAASPSMSSTPRPGSSTGWSACGATAQPAGPDRRGNAQPVIKKVSGICL